MNPSPILTIGKVAKLANVSVETIRYYERSGLIAKPKKYDGTYREYSRDTIQRIHFIKGAQELGFKLSEISELLSLRINGKTTPKTIRTKADLKLKQVEQKIAELNRIREALLQIRESCGNQEDEKNCKILDSFYESENASVLAFIGMLPES